MISSQNNAKIRFKDNCSSIPLLVSNNLGFLAKYIQSCYRETSLYLYVVFFSVYDQLKVKRVSTSETTLLIVCNNNVMESN